jgi:hypothetical protein
MCVARQMLLSWIGVVRNKSIDKLNRPLLIDTHDANRRELVWLRTPN